MSCVSWTFLPPDLRPLFALMMRWTIPIRVALAILRQRSAWTSKIERWDMSRSPTHHAGQVADDDCGAETCDQQGCVLQALEDEAPLAASRHHPGIGQRHQMLRHLRLPLPQETLQVADSRLARTGGQRTSRRDCGRMACSRSLALMDIPSHQQNGPKCAERAP